MPRHARPSYRFEYRHGLSSSGMVERISPIIDGGQIHRIRYCLDDFPLMTSSGQPMSAEAADMIDVGAAVYVADRLALRKVDGDHRSATDRWHRQIHVVIPVRHPDRWRHPEIIACLEELLAFLTDDIWNFEFVERSCSPRPAEAQVPYLRPPGGEVAIALHSGGLDSLLGLIALTTKGHEEMIVPVTVVTTRRVRRVAESVIKELRRSLAVAELQLLPARLHVGISGLGRRRYDREPTQRARAMLFLATGVVAAVIAGTNRLRLCENGVGAISLPMTPDHWGARATRAMHPKTLMLMSGLASIVLDQPILIENAGLFVTKGELARQFGSDRFIAAARHTVSCDQASYLGRGEACGKCTSCILRRVALTAADLDIVVDRDAVKYRTDWFDSGTSWGRESAVHLTAMRDQVERLREAIGGAGGFAALDAAFPELLDVVALAPTLGLTQHEVQRRLLQLYETHVREFDAFMAKIDRPGWGRMAIVTDLIATPEAAAAG